MFISPTLLKEIKTPLADDNRAGEEAKKRPDKRKITVENISHGTHDPDRVYHVRKVIRLAGIALLAAGVLLSITLAYLAFLGVSIFGFLIYITHYPEAEVICPRCQASNIIRRRVGAYSGLSGQ